MIRVYAVICEDPGGTDSLDHAVFHVQIRAEGLVIVDDLPALNQKAVALPETREDGSVFSTPSSSTLSRNFPTLGLCANPSAAVCVPRSRHGSQRGHQLQGRSRDAQRQDRSTAAPTGPK